ncbi:MAG TPA: DJ-1/PfpI family protein [Sedimentisphaerales bacterium]|mgnify:CR=1 FL=1|nr:DJ-1/PfpI family protein [Sedimentisphaerales bacterium]HRS11257.1 DJ-1/PfpI family protein [Sedimentisphaerales bacterium]HRV47835.1 DJ-1/PfpI family protein [Sedimentisphaerales bacterium]
MMRQTSSMTCCRRGLRWVLVVLVCSVPMRACPELAEGAYSAAGEGASSRAIAPYDATANRGTRSPRGARLTNIQLPAPAASSAVSVERALTLSQNLEFPSDQKLTLEQISQLAWAAQGVTAPRTDGTTATPGSLSPLKVYFALPEGTYLYEPIGHTLQQISDNDVRAAIAAAVFSRQPNVSIPATATGSCQIIITGSVRDFSPIYGQNARSVMALLAGQMSQSVQLQAVSLDLTYIASSNVDSSAIKRTLRLSRAADPIYVALIGYPASRAAQAATSASQAAAGQGYARAVLIAPPNGFQDQELSETARTLALANVQTVIASTRASRIVGAFGSVAQADLPLNQVKVEDFDAFVFIGGIGTMEYYNNPLAVGLARRAVAQQKVVAASSTAPVILAHAGVLRGIRATCLPAERNQLVAAGAVFTGAAVERDGRIITSTGPLVVPLFASTIVEALAGN